MSGRIGLVTDSNSQLTDDLADRYQVEVVPLTVTIDGRDHLEGVDLDADRFYAEFEMHTPEISTAQPSPGRFAEVYAQLAERGATHIVSIHLSSAMSGTVGSATLAAQSSPVPVEVVDTETASFGVAACVWAAGDAIAAGADVAGVRAAVGAIGPRIGTCFIAGVPHLTRRSGRAGAVELDGDGIAVLAMRAGDLQVLDRAHTVEDAVAVMSRYVATVDGPSTVAIGVADDATRSLAELLAAEVERSDVVDEVIGYRVGPSVGAHTGPGTFGLFVFPTIGRERPGVAAPAHGLD